MIFRSPPRWLALVGLAGGIAFSAPARTAAQEAEHAVSFDVSLSRPDAMARATTALTSQGYTIASTKADVITTNPHDVERICHVRLFAKFFAIDTLTTRVVVTGEYTIEMAQPDPANIEEASRGVAADVWNELRTAADNIRRVSATP